MGKEETWSSTQTLRRGGCVPRSLWEGCALFTLLTTCPMSSPCPCRSHPMLASRHLATLPDQPPGTARAGWEKTSHPPSRCGFGGLEGSTHGGGDTFTACLLAPMGCPAPCFCLGVCYARCPQLGSLWWEGQKGYPKKSALLCKARGGCSAVPTPAPCHVALKSCNLPTPT